MRFLCRSLPLLLLTAGFSLHGAVPAPTFSSAVQASVGVPSAARIVGSKTVPTVVNGVDSGRDTIVPVNFSGYSNTWDIVTVGVGTIVVNGVNQVLVAVFLSNAITRASSSRPSR